MLNLKRQTATHEQPALKILDGEHAASRKSMLDTLGQLDIERIPYVVRNGQLKLPKNHSGSLELAKTVQQHSRALAKLALLFDRWHCVECDGIIRGEMHADGVHDGCRYWHSWCVNGAARLAKSAVDPELEAARKAARGASPAEQLRADLERQGVEFKLLHGRVKYRDDMESLSGYQLEQIDKHMDALTELMRIEANVCTRCGDQPATDSSTWCAGYERLAQ